METDDILMISAPIIHAFESLGISYYIGGSVASSAHGIFRATLDVDLVADVKPCHVRLLVKKLEAEYYIDEEMLLEAIQRQASCNLIHLDTMHKVDIFILRRTPYETEAFNRRRKDTLDEEHDVEFFLASPEDTILHKLDWYREGGEVSDRQWADVLGVLKVQKEGIDMEYLRHWAAELDLNGLLEKACQDAGIS
jgi:hypothetical protein